MKTSILLLLALFSPLSSFAESGNVLICASEDNEVKMTADLSDGVGQKVAKASLEGIPMLFPEAISKKTKNTFSFHLNKSTPLLVTSVSGKNAEITLTTNPEHNHLQVVHDVTEPAPLKISKFSALLSVPKLEINEQAVNCTETKWQY